MAPRGGSVKLAKEAVFAYGQAVGVSCRAAELRDAYGVMTLNTMFREEMGQWEQHRAGVRTKPSYAELPLEEIEDIICEETPGNLIVLVRKGGSRQERDTHIGYLYSYLEPWGEGGDLSTRRRPRQSQNHAKEPPAEASVYIAELFVVASERGLGLGELLLTESLRLRAATVSRCHLFVSSCNVSAVNCYLKFGFRRSKTPSGDPCHDLVMELPDAQESIAEAAYRLEARTDHLAHGPPRATPPSSPSSGYTSGSSVCPSPVMGVRATPPPAGGFSPPFSLSPPALRGRGKAHHLPQSLSFPTPRGRVTREASKRARSPPSSAAAQEVGQAPGRRGAAKRSTSGAGGKRGCGGGGDVVVKREKRGKFKGMVVMVLGPDGDGHKMRRVLEAGGAVAVSPSDVGGSGRAYPRGITHVIASDNLVAKPPGGGRGGRLTDAPSRTLALDILRDLYIAGARCLKGSWLSYAFMSERKPREEAFAVDMQVFTRKRGAGAAGGHDQGRFKCVEQQQGVKRRCVRV